MLEAENEYLQIVVTCDVIKTFSMNDSANKFFDIILILDGIANDLNLFDTNKRISYSELSGSLLPTTILHQPNF